MKAIALAAMVGGVIGAIAIPAGSVGASPPPSGASVVFQQNGVTVTKLCASTDVFVVATGFAPNRHTLTTRVEIVGGSPFNPLFFQDIPLTNGAGSADTGYPGPGFIGDKVRVRYQTGSSSHPSNLGSMSATVIDC